MPRQIHGVKTLAGLPHGQPGERWPLACFSHPQTTPGDHVRHCARRQAGQITDDTWETRKLVDLLPSLPVPAVWGQLWDILWFFKELFELLPTERLVRVLPSSLEEQDCVHRGELDLWHLTFSSWERCRMGQTALLCCVQNLGCYTRGACVSASAAFLSSRATLESSGRPWACPRCNHMEPKGWRVEGLAPGFLSVRTTPKMLIAPCGRKDSATVVSSPRVDRRALSLRNLGHGT